MIPLNQLVKIADRRLAGCYCSSLFFCPKVSETVEHTTTVRSPERKIKHLGSPPVLCLPMLSAGLRGSLYTFVKNNQQQKCFSLAILFSKRLRRQRLHRQKTNPETVTFFSSSKIEVRSMSDATLLSNITKLHLHVYSWSQE